MTFLSLTIFAWSCRRACGNRAFLFRSQARISSDLADLLVEPVFDRQLFEEEPFVSAIRSQPAQGFDESFFTRLSRSFLPAWDPALRNSHLTFPEWDQRYVFSPFDRSVSSSGDRKFPSLSGEYLAASGHISRSIFMSL